MTFEGAGMAAEPPLGLVTGRELGAPVDIDGNFCGRSDSSSDGEGVGGKYSKLGESKL